MTQASSQEAYLYYSLHNSIHQTLTISCIYLVSILADFFNFPHRHWILAYLSIPIIALYLLTFSTYHHSTMCPPVSPTSYFIRQCSNFNSRSTSHASIHRYLNLKMCIINFRSLVKMLIESSYYTVLHTPNIILGYVTLFNASCFCPRPFTTWIVCPELVS